MGLVAHIGERRKASDEVTQYALENSPAILLDCANTADAHRYHGPYSAEQLHEVHVVSIDLLHSYPEVLRQIPAHMQKLSAEVLCITCAEHLFHYQDEEENTDIRAQAWTLLEKLSRRYDVHVAVKKGGRHEAWARKYANMGHTTSSQRQVSENLIRELKDFIQTLPASEQQRAKQLLDIPLQRLSAITAASSLHTWAFLLLCIILEQDKHG